MCETQYKIRPAKVGDVPRILSLINNFAKEGLMLSRGPQSAYENIRDFVVAEDCNGEIQGCGAFHVLWHDVGEIRGLAVDKKMQGLGVGKAIVETLFQDVIRLGIPRVFTFTYVPKFFNTLDFRLVKHGELPQKLYSECSRCPKFFCCDETPMMRNFSKELGIQYEITEEEVREDLIPQGLFREDKLHADERIKALIPNGELYEKSAA